MPARHSPAILLLALLAVAHTWPLAPRLADSLPGLGPGDNITALWNFWWMREAVARPDVAFFATGHLFAPVGAPLVLHTHMAPSALAGATVLSAAALPAALNLTLIAAVMLNGVTAYGLAFAIAGRRSAAVLAGVLFMLAPPLLARLMGHFNLVHAWTLVAAVWLVVRMTSTRQAIAAGAAMALVAWTDYYLFVYSLGAIATLAAAQHWHPRLTRAGGAPSAAAAACAAGAALCAAASAIVLSTGGGAVTLLGVPISMQTADNPLMAMWVLGIAAVIIRWRVRLRLDRSTVPAAPWIRRLPMALAVGAIGAAPLAWMALELWLTGGYATQHSSWRTAPRGVDLATLVIGPPFHGAVGDGVRAVYQRLGIDVMESSAWLGIVGCVLAVLAVRTPSLAEAVRPWKAIGAVFFVWALGPFLTVGGFNTWLVLPQALLRYLPVLGNARMPSRALIVVALAVALLAAIWAARRSRRTAIMTTVLAVLELLAAPVPMTALHVPQAYRALAAEPRGNVLELPLGYRDGFGEAGDFDDRVLLYQTVHGHPIAGGFVARLSPAVRDRYQQHPVLGALLAPSRHSIDGGLGCDGVASLVADGFRYVVIDKERLPADVAAMVPAWPLSPLAESGSRSVFRLNASCVPNQPPPP